MITIESRNAHTALPHALNLLWQRGIQEDSRNGPVLRAPGPVTTVLTSPLERLVFHPWRDANPFFLNVEALWLLAGRDDLKQLTPYVKRMADFSDDGGKTSPGSYGKRWRGWFWQSYEIDDPVDQINWVVNRLKENPSDRRTVIQMWDPVTDIYRSDHNGKDVPCNLTVLPWISEGALHLTVFNRSNDIIWGLYSANAVQFSTLLEYLAARIGIRPGTLQTVSNNFHAYLNTIPDKQTVLTRNLGHDPYVGEGNAPPLLGDLWHDQQAKGDSWCERTFQEDLRMLFEYKTEETQLKARSSYLRQVTLPLVIAHKHYRKTKGVDRYLGALDIISQMTPCDWKNSALQWMQRRLENYQNSPLPADEALAQPAPKKGTKK